MQPRDLRGGLRVIPDAGDRWLGHAAPMDHTPAPGPTPAGTSPGRRRALDQLVADGILSPGQAEAVVAALEADRGPAAAPEGISRVAEALGYLGAAVAGAAALAIAAQVWDLLAVGAQAALLAVAALALWAAGEWVHRPDAPGPVRRLVGFCWLLACGAIAGAVAIAADALGVFPDEGVALPVGVVVTAVAAALWRRRPGALTLLPLFLGAQTAALGVLANVEAPPDELFGVLVWAVAVGWMALVWGTVVHPPGAGYVLGGIGALAGAQMLTVVHTGPGIALGLVTAAALLAGVRLRHGALVGLGAAGSAVFAAQALAELFPDAVTGPVIVFLGGLVLLGLALASARGRP